MQWSVPLPSSLKGLESEHVGWGHMGWGCPLLQVLLRKQGSGLPQITWGGDMWEKCSPSSNPSNALKICSFSDSSISDAL